MITTQAKLTAQITNRLGTAFDHSMTYHYLFIQEVPTLKAYAAYS